MLSCSFSLKPAEAAGLALGRWRVGRGEDEIRVFVETKGLGTLVRFERGSGPVGIAYSEVSKLAELVDAARGLIAAAGSGELAATSVPELATALGGPLTTEPEFSLDREKLSALRSETAEVAAFLAHVFEEEVEDISEAATAGPEGGYPEDGGNPSPGPATGVPHREWVKVLSEGPESLDWDEFEASARTHGIQFVDGAMEEINAYVLEAAGDFGLGDRGGVVVINQQMLEWVL